MTPVLTDTWPSSECLFLKLSFQSRGLQPLGLRPVLVRGLLGTGPYNREVSLNVMHLNYSEIIPSHPPPPSMEKLSSIKPVPDAKKAGNRCFKGHKLPKIEEKSQVLSI